MFKKDEYDQEEYNDYYQQEVAGAELNGSKEEESGGMGKFIALFVLIILAVAGYFGYNMMNNTAPKPSEEIDTSLKVSMASLPQSVQNEQEETEPTKSKNNTEHLNNKTKEVAKDLEPKTITETEVKEVAKVETETIKADESSKVQNTVTQEVQKAVAGSGKMSPEEVASIVAAVMLQMNQSKDTTANTKKEPIADKQDVALMNDLSDSVVDSVSADLIKELANIDLNKDTQIDNSKKQVDVYNKVNVQSVTGNDTLSQLSNEINNVISEGISENKAKTYTESLKSEVNVRQNEMRIIVVKKGDTLGKLAHRAYGNVMDYKRIYRANPELTRPDRIYIGQKLRIPN